MRKGATERSNIRYFDLLFERGDPLQSIIATVNDGMAGNDRAMFVRTNIDPALASGGDAIEADVNGDGAVNAFDKTLLTRSPKRKLPL